VVTAHPHIFTRLKFCRASLPVARHHPRIVRLEFNGEGPITRQVFFAGKGIVYDTGGADVKTGGHMAGMSRDKCGAAVAAGFIRTAAALNTKGLRAVAYLGFVRNSIGSDAYVADEIITSHAGVRVLVINTDAEGRMVMIDLLSHIREEITAQPKETRPSTVVHSIATLTGHAVLAVGPGYSIAVDNGPARADRVAESLKAAGEAHGDPFEISSLRREDFDFVAPKTSEYDVKQVNNAPSVATPRGHQFPAAVMAIASRLDKHGQESSDPIAYSHLDIAGSSVAAPFLDGVVTGNPVPALVARYAQ
jgi:leucyl aminopeptidase